MKKPPSVIFVEGEPMMHPFVRPNSLLEAIKVGAAIGPLSDSFRNQRLAVIDFLAHQFRVAYLQAQSIDELDRLRGLFKSLLKEHNDEKAIHHED